MKTKAILFIGAIALGTLSFTFSSVNSPREIKQQANSYNQVEPIRGFVAEDLVK